MYGRTSHGLRGDSSMGFQGRGDSGILNSGNFHSPWSLRAEHELRKLVPHGSEVWLQLAEMLPLALSVHIKFYKLVSGVEKL